MAASYNPELPTPKDVIRLIIGDVGPTFLMSDEEIEGLYAQSGENLVETIGRAFEALASDPRKLNILRDIVGGTVTIAELMAVYAAKAARWTGR
jgi:hypothetical protein